MNESMRQYPVGAAAWTQARALFEEQGLRIPSCSGVPEGTLAQVSDWVFASRTPPHDLYHIEGWLHELAAVPVGDYLAFGVSGHGIQSWAFHWYEVTGVLAVLVQLPWGGAYGHAEEEALRIHTAFGRIAALRAVAGESQAAGAIPAGCRFVLAGGLGASRVGWVGSTGRTSKGGGSTLWNFRHGYEEALASLKVGPGAFEEYNPYVADGAAEDNR